MAGQGYSLVKQVTHFFKHLCVGTKKFDNVKFCKANPTFSIMADLKRQILTPTQGSKVISKFVLFTMS